MPQKRNPDAAELVRGKTGRVIGALVGLLTVMKGLALTYFKDMQEDKEGVFDAAETLTLVLAATAGMVRDLKPDVGAAGRGRRRRLLHRDRPRRLAGARAEDALPRRPPRHRRAGGEGRGARAWTSPGLTLAEMQAAEPRITQGVFDVLTVAASVASRTSYGGTAPANVAAHGGGMAGAAGVSRAASLLLALAPALLLAACGRAGPPRQPGPPEAITYPRVYPAPDPPPRIAPASGPTAPRAAPMPDPEALRGAPAAR